MRNYLIAAIFLVGLTIAPLALAQAPSVAEQIAQLQARIAVLQEQIRQLQQRQQGGFCHIFVNNLRVGVSHPDVSKLINSLYLENVARAGINFPVDGPSQYFGKPLERAVIKFQEKYASEILKPYGPRLALTLYVEIDSSPLIATN